MVNQLWLKNNIFRYSNGDSFEGFFQNGLRHGSGSLKYSNGTRRDGEWKEDKLHGFIFYHFSGNDSPSVERWLNGIKVSETVLSTSENGNSKT